MTSGYFDYAAATPLDSEVLKAMEPYFSDVFYNPSATYLAARRANEGLDHARCEVAEVLGAKSTEIIFTAGGSEANNLAVHGIMRQYPDGHCVISAIEHDSLRRPAARYNYVESPVRPQGVLDVEQLIEQITDKTVLVSVMYANNEIGTIQPIRRIALALENVRKIRHSSGNKLPIYLHTDAAQAGNYLDLHVHRLGVDMMTLNGGKLYGPKQTGALYVRTGIELMPLIDGGGQERGLRSGTENIAGAIGFSTALRLAQVRKDEETERLLLLRQLMQNLLQSHVPEARINGSMKHRLPNNIHITMPGEDNERLLLLLEQAGFLAAAGSACSASHEEPSHVLQALGMPTEDIRSSLRFTMGRQTSQTEVEKLVDVLSSIASS